MKYFRFVAGAAEMGRSGAGVAQKGASSVKHSSYFIYIYTFKVVKLIKRRWSDHHRIAVYKIFFSVFKAATFTDSRMTVIWWGWGPWGLAIEVKG